MYEVELFKSVYRDEIIQLIVNIQRNEFGINITEQDQPDLSRVEEFYQKGKGNFWVALEDKKPVGTIALIDIGNNQGVIRKMFVHKDHRGRDKGVAQQLYDMLEMHCREHDIRELFLGTIHVFEAAQRFYVRNGFVRVEVGDLPGAFPVMVVDDVFFRKEVGR